MGLLAGTWFPDFSRLNGAPKPHSKGTVQAATKDVPRAVQCAQTNRCGHRARCPGSGIPEDEICFYVFDAQSAHHAARAAQRAALDPIRVVEAVSSERTPQ